MSSGLDRLTAMMNADDPEETSKQKKDAVDEDTVRTVLYEHPDIEPPHYRSVRTQEQIIETVRWTFAMDDVYRISTRRKAAQKLVAEHTEPQHDDNDGDKDSISTQAVQNKVRRLFDGRYGRQSAQDIFDDVLEDVEEAYNVRVENS